MEIIKDTLEQVMRGLKEQKKVSAYTPEALIKKIFTLRERRHIKFHYFKKGVLNIKVESSSWLYHLSLQKEKLLTKLRKQSSIVKDIRFRIGEVN